MLKTYLLPVYMQDEVAVRRLQDLYILTDTAHFEALIFYLHMCTPKGNDNHIFFFHLPYLAGMLTCVYDIRFKGNSTFQDNGNVFRSNEGSLE